MIIILEHVFYKRIFTSIADVVKWSYFNKTEMYYSTWVSFSSKC